MRSKVMLNKQMSILLLPDEDGGAGWFDLLSVPSFAGKSLGVGSESVLVKFPVLLQ